MAKATVHIDNQAISDCLDFTECLAAFDEFDQVQLAIMQAEMSEISIAGLNDEPAIDWQ